MRAVESEVNRAKSRWQWRERQAKSTCASQRSLYWKQRRRLNRVVIEVPRERPRTVGPHRELIARLDPVDRASEGPHDPVPDDVSVEYRRRCVAKRAEHSLEVESEEVVESIVAS